MDHFLHSATQLWILASLAPPDLFIHDRDHHGVQVVVIHILAESFADLSVQLISMHDCRDYVVRSELLLYEVECFFIEPLSVLIASMILEVLCIDINNNLIEQGRILAETSGGDQPFGFEPLENLSVGLITRVLEVDVVSAHPSNNVLIAIGLIPAFVMSVNLVKA